MRAAEILRHLIDTVQKPNTSAGITINIGTINIDTPEEPKDRDQEVDLDVMVPPLQQKIELLKIKKKNVFIKN